MKLYGLMLSAACFCSAPLLAQPQIGGGTCSSASLSGNYSLTLSGRDVSSTLTFAKVSQGIGTATFDGQSKVTFTLTNNTNQAFGTAETLSGTYSMQANCIGVLNITTGDTASFALESYNLGKNFLITGQDGTYSFTGNGGLLPTAACTASGLIGSYAFNGTGYALASGAVSGVTNVSATLQLDGKSAFTGNFYISTGASTVTDAVSGQFTVTSGCTGTAKLSDTTGNAYSIVFTLTSVDGANFLLSGSNAALMFSGNGRTI